MNPWYENLANVPCHSTGVLYERLLSPNKKQGVSHQKPGVGYG